MAKSIPLSLPKCSLSSSKERSLLNSPGLRAGGVITKRLRSMRSTKEELRELPEFKRPLWESVLMKSSVEEMKKKLIGIRSLKRPRRKSSNVK